MVNMTIAIPEEVHRKMKMFTEVRWSEVARKAVEQRVNDLEELNSIASKSRLTQKDVECISEKIKAAAAKKFLR